jgi:hypothetical protein
MIGITYRDQDFLQGSGFTVLFLKKDELFVFLCADTVTQHRGKKWKPLKFGKLLRKTPLLILSRGHFKFIFMKTFL